MKTEYYFRITEIKIKVIVLIHQVKGVKFYSWHINGFI